MSLQRTGVRLLVLALAIELVSVVVLQSAFVLGSVWLPDEPTAASAFYHVTLPAIDLVLALVVGVTGFLGLVFVERARGRVVRPVGGPLDRTRSAIMTAAGGGVVLVVSGLVLGAMYVPDAIVWGAIRVGVRFLTIVAIGFALFWTAGRIDSRSLPLARIALRVGIASGLFGTATAAASLALATSPDPADLSTVQLLGFLGYFAPAIGVASLAAWVVVYRRLAVTVPGSGGSTVRLADA